MKRIILMYHDVYQKDISESGFQNSTALKYKVSSKAFEAHVKAVDSYLRENKLPTSTVEFTFDDGGISFLTEIAPILEKYGFRGIFFISTAYIGCEKFLKVEEIKELVRRGHTIGSHSHTHPERMSAIGSDHVHDEWKYSQMILTEILGKSSNVASIPNGYSSKSVLKAMNKEGITNIYTSSPTTKVKKFRNSQIIGRYVITDNDDVLTVMSIVSSPFYRFKQNARFKCLGIAKAILGDTYLKLRNKMIK